MIQVLIQKENQNKSNKANCTHEEKREKRSSVGHKRATSAEKKDVGQTKWGGKEKEKRKVTQELRSNGGEKKKRKKGKKKVMQDCKNGKTKG